MLQVHAPSNVIMLHHQLHQSATANIVVAKATVQGMLIHANKLGADGLTHLSRGSN